jgi:hypothetical protein
MEGTCPRPLLARLHERNVTVKMGDNITHSTYVTLSPGLAKHLQNVSFE